MRIEELILENKNFFCIDNLGLWTHSDICKKITELKIALWSNDIRRKDKVAIICENGSSFIIALIAIFSCGAIAVPIDPQLPSLMVEELLEKVDVKMICLSGKRASNIVTGIKDNKFMTLIQENGEWNCIKDGQVLSNNLEVGSDNEEALIMYTSGTNGNSKGVVVTHKAIINNVEAISEYMGVGEQDIFYIIKTMCHSSTLVGEILVAIKNGCGILAFNQLTTPKKLLRRIDKFKPTILFVNPTILRLLIRLPRGEFDFSSIKEIYVSGEVLSKELLCDAEKFFYNSKIINVYGLTEAGPRITAQRKDIQRKHGSVGKPIKDVKVYIYHLGRFHNIPYKQGPIYVETKSLMKEYYGDELMTKTRIVNGLLNTGDIGYLDEDGDLFVLGRGDNVIIRGGHNINPEYIENLLIKFNGIIECAIFGVKDDLQGEIIICLFTSDKNIKVSFNELSSYLNKFLPKYSIPQEIYEVEKIPKTINGKISRRNIKTLYSENKLKLLR